MTKIITIRETGRDYVIDDKVYYDAEYGMIQKKVITLDEDGNPNGILTVSPVDIVEMHETYTEEKIKRLENVANMAQEIAEGIIKKKVEGMKIENRTDDMERDYV